MAITSRYSIYPVSLASATPLYLQQLNSVRVRPDAKKETVVPGGAIDPAAVILNYAEPAIEIATKDIATALAGISPTAGLACSAGSNVVQFQQRADGSTFSGGSTFVVLTNKKGFVYPKTLTVDQDQEGGADLELELVCQWDGTSSGTPTSPVPPLAIGVAQAGTSTPTFNGRFYLGPVYLAAAQLAGVKGWQVDFGIKYEVVRADGEIWGQVGSIISRMPKLKFRVLKLDLASTVSSLFNAPLGGALNLYARAGLSGSARVSDATAAHLKITAATGAWSADEIEVKDNEDGTMTVAVDLTGLIAVSTASTIP